MATQRPRILVVDDSPLMRRHIQHALESRLEVEVSTARDGQDALDKIQALDPVVVTLDINMPVMDGLTCLAHIMEQSPRPVVMLSSLTEHGAFATFEALAMGAVDYVPKPGGTVSHNVEEVSDLLAQKVVAAAEARPQARPKAERTAPPPRRASRTSGRYRDGRGVLLIGASTGGPGTVEALLHSLDPDLPVPVVVAQHMPSPFTAVFAKRLDATCGLEVVEVDRPTPVQAGTVYIARGDADLIFERRLSRAIVNSVPSDEKFLWHPSVERMVLSAMDIFDPEHSAAVLLTGMGNDGAHAMNDFGKRGAYTIAEHESTAVVYGMPRVLAELGGAKDILPREEIADHINRWGLAEEVALTRRAT